MFVPKLDLVKSRTSICMSLTMSFLHENNTLAYFVSLGDRSSSLSLHTSQRSDILVAFRRPNIGREHSFLAFFMDCYRHTLQLNGHSHKVLELAYVKYVLSSKSGLKVNL